VKIYLHNLLLIMIITDIPYFGSISFIKSLMNEDQVYFDFEQPFSKMSFKNRMIIATAQGPLHLTIPVIGGRDQKTAIKDIKIAYTSKWNEHHLKSIITNYKRAPFYEYYETDLIQIYNRRPEFLVDFLLEIQVWVKDKIKGAWIIEETPKNNATRIFDKWLPKNYFEIKLPLKYHQVFEEKTGFIPNLSILDILFCCGGKQANYLIATL